MIDLEELFERSDELRNILDESKKTELSEYLNRFTADEISEFFGMLVVQVEDPTWTTYYLKVMTVNCLRQLVDVPAFIELQRGVSVSQAIEGSGPFTGRTNQKISVP